jgi:hypothetical protein
MIALFSLRLLLGMALTWAVLPRRQITSGFFRIQLLLALALSVLVTVTIRDQTAILAGFEQLFPPNTIVDWPEPASFGIAVCVILCLLTFAGSVAWTLERRFGGTVFLLATLTLSFSVLAIGAMGAAQGNGINLLLFLASEFASSAVLGSSVTGMLLGHWYLTAPTMSIAPLGRANAWFGVTLLFRLILSAIGLWMSWSSLSGSTHLVWLALRWSAGIVLPLILCVMTARILKYRNTQSATGVLFAAVILIFLGELAGMLLAREIGLPL